MVMATYLARSLARWMATDISLALCCYIVHRFGKRGAFRIGPVKLP
jgi:hypothetical protein